MVQITNYFEQAQLSLAAYGLGLQQGMFGRDNADYVAALKDAGMSQTQAEEFAVTYRVLAQSPETGFFDNGFSATTFQNVESGEIHIAIRGSDTFFADWLGGNLGDIGADGVAIHQTIALFNWLQRLIGAPGDDVVQYNFLPTETDEITGEIIPPRLATTTATATGELAGQNVPLTVTGHSLGGHLAMILGRLAPNLVSEVHAYNAPGFDPFGTGVTSEGFFELFRTAPVAPVTGAIGTVWNPAIMTHAAVEGDILRSDDDAPERGTKVPLTRLAGVPSVTRERLQQITSVWMRDVFATACCIDVSS